MPAAQAATTMPGTAGTVLQDLIEDLQQEANIPVDVATLIVNPYINNAITTANEDVRYVDRVFQGKEAHNKSVIKLALKQLNKIVPQATYKLNQFYSRKLQENKANSVV
eukprot:6030690-Ditylum_brightwellii.AAC.1